jgi:hypothetical protein
VEIATVVEEEAGMALGGGSGVLVLAPGAIADGDGLGGPCAGTVGSGAGVGVPCAQPADRPDSRISNSKLIGMVLDE